MPTSVTHVKLSAVLFSDFICLSLHRHDDDDGFVLSIDNVPRECYPGEWPCPSSGLCIPMDHLCDGTAHCPEGEDETNITAGHNCS